MREFSIVHPNDSLTSLEISGSDRLEIITGINLLPNLKELELSVSENLHTVTGLELATALEKIIIRSLPPSLIKRSLKTQIASGKYKSFFTSGTEIDLEHGSFPESQSIAVKLLAQETSSLAAPTTMLPMPQPALAKAVYPLAVPKSLRSSPKIQTFQ